MSPDNDERANEAMMAIYKEKTAATTATKVA
jgi:hypothetical protein